MQHVNKSEMHSLFDILMETRDRISGHYAYPGLHASTLADRLPFLHHDSVDPPSAVITQLPHAPGAQIYVYYNDIKIYCGSVENLELFVTWVSSERTLFEESDILEVFTLWMMGYDVRSR